MDHMKQKVKEENGAIIVEAALSLSFFIFALIIVYSMVHFALAQARISAALNSTAKEISQYSYVYDLTGLNEKQANLAANGGAAECVLSDNLSQINGVYDAFKGIASGTMSIISNPENTESFLYYVLNQGIDQVKGDLTGVVARLLMRKHFGSDPDKFLKGLGIKDGMSGLSFIKTRIFREGEDNDIILDVRYKVQIFKLLDFDMSLNFENCAQTRAWVGAD